MDQELELQKDFLQDGREWEHFQRHFYGSIKPAEEEPDASRKKTLASAMEEREMLKNELLETTGRRK